MDGPKENRHLEFCPNELIVKIFKFLDTKDHLNLRFIKRFRKICIEFLDESVHNLRRNELSLEHLQIVLKKNCKYLNLSQSIVKDSDVTLTKASNLKYLNFNGCCVDDNVIKKLLSVCHLLEKLSIDYKSFSYNDIFDNIRSILSQNCNTLRVLNIRIFGIFDVQLCQLLGDCNQLTELNLNCTIYGVTIDSLIAHLTPNLRKLCLSGDITLHYVEKIVRKCNKLQVLAFKNSERIGIRSLEAIERHLKDTLKELDVSSAESNLRDQWSFYPLAYMPKLKILRCHRNFEVDLAKEFPRLIVTSSKVGLNVANPNMPIGHESGLWEIYPDYQFPTGYSYIVYLV